MFVFVFTPGVCEKLIEPTEYAKSMNHDIGGESTSNKYGDS